MNGAASPASLYWEDFQPGMQFTTAARTLDQREIVAFASEFDPQVFHVDPVAAAESAFGGLIASGWHVCGIAMRLVCDAFLLRTAMLASPGVDNIRFVKPVRAGDTLQVVARILHKRESVSNPRRGLIGFGWEILNQHGQVACTVEVTGLVHRRPAP